MFQLQPLFCSIVTNGTALQLCRDTSLSQELHYCSYAGSSIKRKCCQNDQTNDNSFLNIINIYSTIQVRGVLWSGFYHTGSLLKQYKNEFYFVRWLKKFRHYKVFDKKIPGCMTYVVHPVLTLEKRLEIYKCVIKSMGIQYSPFIQASHSASD